MIRLIAATVMVPVFLAAVGAMILVLPLCLLVALLEAVFDE